MDYRFFRNLVGLGDCRSNSGGAGSGIPVWERSGFSSGGGLDDGARRSRLNFGNWLWRSLCGVGLAAPRSRCRSVTPRLSPVDIRNFRGGLVAIAVVFDYPKRLLGRAERTARASKTRNLCGRRCYDAGKTEYFHEEGSFRGAFSSRELFRDPPVNSQRRERPLPAFRLSSVIAQGFATTNAGVDGSPF
jgi:hypothetical protein